MTDAALTIAGQTSSKQALTRVSVELPLAIGRALDYFAPADWEIGPNFCVEVTVGVRPHIGVVTAANPIDAETAATLKPVRRVICTALPEALIDLAGFVAGYYQVSLGMACGLISPMEGAPLPEATSWQLTASGSDHAAQIPARNTAQRALVAALLSGLDTDEMRALSSAQRRTLNDWIAQRFVEAVFPDAKQPVQVHPVLPEFTMPQREASTVLRATVDRFGVSLLHGVTGSGKTEVYLDLVAAVLNAGKQVLLLVPEINLTPQLIDRVLKALPGVPTAVLHSKLAAGERNRAWHSVHSGAARLIIGTRLAVFASASDLGLIVIDEEHDGSYKQNESPRYHARDVAIVRAKQANIPVVLASATPSLETWRNVRHARSDVYQHIVLSERATAAQPSALRLVPSRGKRVK